MNIFNFFARSAALHPDKVALAVNGAAHTYEEVGELAGRLSRLLADDGSGRVAVLCYRSLPAYAAVLGALQAGKTYVPLNPKFPAARNAAMLELSEAGSIVVDRRCAPVLAQLADRIRPGTRIILAETLADPLPAAITGRLAVAGAEASKPSRDIADVDGEANAYLLFTSGSTGVPKGVAVTHGNVRAYVDYMQSRYRITSDDRLSQTFDMTFDLSVHDMFMAYRGGAALHVVPEGSVLAPAKFVRDNQLTVWFSVPSVAQFMSKLGMLKEGVFPDLRLSLFCGEPLTAALARQWIGAAPNSVVENVYGPTEATIAISHHRLDEADRIRHLNGVVSIGTIFPTQRYCLVDAAGVPAEGEGELCLSGSQITKGYWNDAHKTSEQFVRIPGDDGVWYRTGDLVREVDGELFYISRTDHQVKIRGYRVELNEINNAINEFVGGGAACSVPMPFGASVTDSIVSFIEDRFEEAAAALNDHLKTVLPDYMLPRRLVFVDEFPLNSNGKVDMKALANLVGA